jgi:peptide/nickel transport system permease protein
MKALGKIYSRLINKRLGRSRFSQFIIRLIREKPLATIGGVIMLLMFLVGIFADILAPYGVNQSILTDVLQPPSTTHLLGTDNLGRDLLSRVIHGARISMVIGLSAAAICITVSASVGTISGFLGGKTDIVIQRFVDAWMCFPPLLLYMSIMILIGTGFWQVILVLGIARGLQQSRIVRSAVMTIKNEQYMTAAFVTGSSMWSTLRKHVLPNTMAPIIIIFSLTVGAAILGEATLSFLGLGLPPPTPSWGGMLSGTGRTYMYGAPWLALWPGLALALAVLSVNLFGDGLRDLLDPRLRGGLGRYGVKSIKKLSSKAVHSN